MSYWGKTGKGEEKKRGKCDRKRRKRKDKLKIKIIKMK
jgi:hypothetical protein